MGAFYSCPHQETVAIVESFGKFSRIAYPGNLLGCVVVDGGAHAVLSGTIGRSLGKPG